MSDHADEPLASTGVSIEKTWAATLKASSQPPPTSSSNDQQGTSNQRQGTTSNQRQGTSNHRQGTSNEPQGSSNERRGTSNEGAGASNDRQGTSNERPANKSRWLEEFEKLSSDPKKNVCQCKFSGKFTSISGIDYDEENVTLEPHFQHNVKLAGRSSLRLTPLIAMIFGIVGTIYTGLGLMKKYTGQGKDDKGEKNDVKDSSNPNEDPPNVNEEPNRNEDHSDDTRGKCRTDSDNEDEKLTESILKGIVASVEYMKSKLENRDTALASLECSVAQLAKKQSSLDKHEMGLTSLKCAVYELKSDTARVELRNWEKHETLLASLKSNVDEIKTMQSNFDQHEMSLTSLKCAVYELKSESARMEQSNAERHETSLDSLKSKIYELKSESAHMEQRNLERHETSLASLKSKMDELTSGSARMEQRTSEKHKTIMALLKSTVDGQKAMQGNFEKYVMGLTSLKCALDELKSESARMEQRNQEKQDTVLASLKSTVDELKSESAYMDQRNQEKHDTILASLNSIVDDLKTVRSSSEKQETRLTSLICEVFELRESQSNTQATFKEFKGQLDECGERIAEITSSLQNSRVEPKLELAKAKSTEEHGPSDMPVMPAERHTSIDFEDTVISIVDARPSEIAMENLDHYSDAVVMSGGDLLTSRPGSELDIHSPETCSSSEQVTSEDTGMVLDGDTEDDTEKNYPEVEGHRALIRVDLSKEAAASKPSTDSRESFSGVKEISETRSDSLSVDLGEKNSSKLKSDSKDSCKSRVDESGLQAAGDKEFTVPERNCIDRGEAVQEDEEHSEIQDVCDSNTSVIVKPGVIKLNGRETLEAERFEAESARITNRDVDLRDTNLASSRPSVFHPVSPNVGGFFPNRTISLSPIAPGFGCDSG